MDSDKKKLLEMTSFDWLQGKYTYKNRETGEPIIVTDMDIKKAALQYLDCTVSKKSVGVWKSPNGSMNYHVELLENKAKERISKIEIPPTKFHLAWKILKGGI